MFGEEKYPPGSRALRSNEMIDAHAW